MTRSVLLLLLGCIFAAAICNRAEMVSAESAQTERGDENEEGDPLVLIARSRAPRSHHKQTTAKDWRAPCESRIYASPSAMADNHHLTSELRIPLRI